MAHEVSNGSSRLRVYSTTTRREDETPVEVVPLYETTSAMAEYGRQQQAALNAIRKDVSRRCWGFAFVITFCVVVSVCAVYSIASSLGFRLRAIEESLILRGLRQ